MQAAPAEGEKAKSLTTPAPSQVSSQVTSHPMFAIVGVLFGALTSVFTGRLLSIGSPDLQGAIGASHDSLTWVSTAFNAANMFIGPLTVFLGGLYGPRRVLMWASAVFMLAEFISPFVASNIAALVAVQFIAGLAAGTYYPLTITVVIRNLPLNLLYLGIAAYSLDIIASTHAANALEAWYINNLSWHWIFWSALITTPILLLCLRFGIPPQPLPKRDARTHLWGFLYASIGLTLLYCGLDQGERLDWFNSGIVNAFLLTGIIFTAVALISRRLKPNPLLNMKFLLARNFLLLAFVLFSFRFILLGPTLLLPNFLELLHGYRPDQTGQVLGWIALVELIAAPLAGYLLYKVDSRLVIAIGFFMVGCTSLFNSQITPGWTGETFVITQALNAVGLAFGLTGLVSTILRSGMQLGALKSPPDMLTLSCWFQAIRLFGGEVGKSIMLRSLTVRSTFHYTVLAQNIDGGWLTEERIRLLIGGLFSDGSGLDDAKERAVLALAHSAKQQIGILAIGDAFVLIAVCSFVCLVAAGFLKYAPSLVASTKTGSAPTR
jgi:MFS transporter, DHA2 family, multidrug resistance protein